jgi:hypothetical protein
MPEHEIPDAAGAGAEMKRPRPPWPYQARQWAVEEARVECFSGRDPSDVFHEGVIIGMTEAPTVRVQKDDGQIVSWVLGLTRKALPATSDTAAPAASVAPVAEAGDSAADLREAVERVLTMLDQSPRAAKSISLNFPGLEHAIDRLRREVKPAFATSVRDTESKAISRRCEHGKNRAWCTKSPHRDDIPTSLLFPRLGDPDPIDPSTCACCAVSSDETGFKRGSCTSSPVNASGCGHSYRSHFDNTDAPTKPASDLQRGTGAPRGLGDSGDAR